MPCARDDQFMSTNADQHPPTHDAIAHSGPPLWCNSVYVTATHGKMGNTLRSVARVIRPWNCNHSWTAKRHRAAGDRGFLPSGSVRATLAQTISSAKTSSRCRRVYAFRHVMPVSNEQKAACRCWLGTAPAPAFWNRESHHEEHEGHEARAARDASCRAKPQNYILFVSFVLFVVCATCVSRILPRHPPPKPLESEDHALAGAATRDVGRTS